MKNLKLTPLPQLPLCLDRSREGEGWALPSELSQLPVHGEKKKKKRKGSSHLKVTRLVCFKASRSMSYPLFQTALLEEGLG